jgi:outer membrane protein assembly factor BamB
MKGQFCAGARVAAYDANNTSIGQGNVTASGVASLSVPSNATVPLHITVGGGQGGSCYWDEAVAAYVSIPAQTVTLNALVPNLQTASASGVGVTFFTELAYQRATSGVPITSLTSSEVQAVNIAVAELFGLAASGVADVLTPPTVIGQNTPRLATSSTAADLYALAVAAMARHAANSMPPNLGPMEVAAQWLSHAAANPASGVAALPEAAGWNAAWAAVTSGASSVLATNVTAPQPPALSGYPLNGPVISFNSALTYINTNGLSGNFTVSGWGGAPPVPLTGSGTFTLGAAVPGTQPDNGSQALQQTQTISGQLSSAGGNLPFGGSATIYLNPVTYAERAISSATYTVYPVFTYPASMRAGNSGLLATATVYSDGFKTPPPLGTEKHSYSVGSDTLSTLLLTFTTDGYDNNNLNIFREQHLYRVALDGAVTPLSIVMVDYGNSGPGAVPFNLNIGISSSAAPPPSPAPAPPPVPEPSPVIPPFVPTPSPTLPLSQSVAYQIDYAHSGQASLTGPITFPNSPAWSVTLGGNISYPLIAGGKVYVLTAGLNGGYGIQLHALNLADGSVAWGPVSISGTYLWAGHAYDHGKIFVVNFDGLLRSFDANTGTHIWSNQLPGQYAFSAPPTAVNGIVYVGGAGIGGTLYAVDETNGAVLWTRAVANGDKSSPVVSNNGLNDGVFVSYPCQVYKFNPLTAASLWHYSGGCSGGGGKTAAYANGLLYVRDWSGVTLGTMIYDAVTGNQVGSLASALIPALTTQTGFYNTAGPVLNSTGSLRAFDPASRNVFPWSFAGDGQLVTAPIVINNQYVIIGSASGNVYAVDGTNNGTLIWTGHAGAAIPGPDEQNVSQPLTGLGAGEGYLVVPAGSKLTVWRMGP